MSAYNYCIILAYIPRFHEDTPISKSDNLPLQFPLPSKIAGFSSREFVGMVADDPTEKIKLKTFHCEILNDHQALRKEQASREELPVVRDLNYNMVTENYFRIKDEVEELIETEIEILLNMPGRC